MPKKSRVELKPIRGEWWHRIDGSKVQIIEKQGDAWKCINSLGKLEMVYVSEFARPASST